MSARARCVCFVRVCVCVQVGEVRGNGPPPPVSWPPVDDARRELRLALADITDARLLPTADGNLGPVGRCVPCMCVRS